MKWKDKLISYLTDHLPDNGVWKGVFNNVLDQKIGLHVAVFTEPFLTLALTGKKKIESRFSQSKIAPFDKINPGDIVLVKESGGLVKGAFIVGKVRFYTFLNEARLYQIEQDYGEAICSGVDPLFWETRSKANVATLVEIKSVVKLTPFNIGKNDRTGWSILKLGYGNTLFK